ncbi:MAG TPA: dihydrofolate reductase family protein [Gemmatimonadales bacterium]|nr:dihydrofolate reductase family protein [Gemmatimonadales bacterium]
MRRVQYSVAMSLDGYIADPQGGYDWIVIDPEIDFDAMFKNFDAVLMGRKSYEQAIRQGGYGLPGPKAYVFSRTLKQENCPGVTVSDDAGKTVRALRRQRQGRDIWLFGGGELFRSLLGLGLVDAIEVAVIPVLLGNGLSMLPAPATLAKLKLAKHRIYKKTGTVLLTYAVK